MIGTCLSYVNVLAHQANPEHTCQHPPNTHTCLSHLVKVAGNVDMESGEHALRSRVCVLKLGLLTSVWILYLEIIHLSKH